MTTTYMPVACQLVGDLENWSTSYMSLGITCTDRADAVSCGIEELGHDAFRIATLIDGRLAAIGWGMDPDFDPAEEDLPDIARQLALTLHESVGGDRVTRLPRSTGGSYVLDTTMQAGYDPPSALLRPPATKEGIAVTVPERHPDGWTVEQINTITDRFRDWFDKADPDLSRMLFNSDLSELAQLAWPIAYQQGRDDESANWSER